MISNNVIGLFAEGATAEAGALITSTPADVSTSGLYSNTEYDVFTKAGASVVANSNWWGDSGGPGDKVSGDVTVDNWCADENCASIVKPATVYLPVIRR